ncbi:iron only hydrogenase large subunit, c-terminal domain-containing protein [Cardiosporidium cionae]|uniref:Iron only hydrogenase large subunit, c-terminal domain-containing protein n=1 Tax=Cardiosporidium cionae TaxID=476202 RepID=A0ABQ7J715_9APIC|nr:iron only hydrogenase large subunit, c-terminal domain-containing protein [Cardiosporidium cionae]|eukprot:KAF8819780.1 iron only hydrogenase large subunit, c-terminal domain-containing protein [Cardiosporidium cionae]
MFSSTIKLTDLNDFLLPSQECIKPLLLTKNASPADGTLLASSQSLPSEPTLPRPNLIRLTSRQKGRKTGVAQPLPLSIYSNRDTPIGVDPIADQVRKATVSIDLQNSSVFDDRTKYSTVNSLADTAIEHKKELVARGSSPERIPGDKPDQIFSKHSKYFHLDKNIIEESAAEDVTTSHRVVERTVEQNPVANTSPNLHQEIHNSKTNPQDNLLVAQVSLFDCLACNGCVTTAETVLLQQQSVQEFLRNLNSKSLSVVSISPQSRTALSNFFHLTADVVMRKLSGFFKGIGVHYVLDTTISESICVLETQREFSQRYRNELARKAGKLLAYKREEVHARSSSPENLSTASTDAKNLNALSPFTEEEGDIHASSSVSYPSMWPLLSSHCPGWICYAEKVLDEAVIPLISRVRSSQQIQGLLVKSLLRKSYNASLFIQKYRSLFCSSLPIFSTSLIPARNRMRSSTEHSSTIYEVLTKYSRCRPATDIPSNTDSTSSTNPSTEGERTFFPPDRIESLNFNNSHGNDVAHGGNSLYRMLQPSDVFHTCIMPCFDKKIESARPEFVHSENSDYPASSSDTTQDVDTVLATSELLELFNLFNIDFMNISECDVDSILTPQSLSLVGINEPIPQNCATPQATSSAPSTLESYPSITKMDKPSANFRQFRPGSVRISEYHGGSGGFVDAVFRHAAKEFYGVHFEGPLPFKIGKNKDYKEVSLTIEGEVVLRCAVAYGFRNIQNVMRRIQNRAKSATKGATQQLATNAPHVPRPFHMSDTAPDLHFIELMACPGGCLNGAGQVLDEAQKLLDKANNEKNELHSKSENAVAFNSNASVAAKTVEYVENKGVNETVGYSNFGNTMAATQTQITTEMMTDTTRNETPWVRDGLSKLEEQKSKLDALERLFHSDSQVPFISPTLIPCLETVYAFLKLRDGRTDVVNLECDPEPVKGVLTQYNSLKGMQLLGNDNGYMPASTLKW